MMPGAPEMLIILVLVLVLFGAGRLPEVFRALGEGVKSFRDAQDGEDEPAKKDPPASSKKLESKTPPVVEASEVEDHKVQS